MGESEKTTNESSVPETSTTTIPPTVPKEAHVHRANMRNVLGALPPPTPATAVGMSNNSSIITNTTTNNPRPNNPPSRPNLAGVMEYSIKRTRHHPLKKKEKRKSPTMNEILTKIDFCIHPRYFTEIRMQLNRSRDDFNDQNFVGFDEMWKRLDSEQKRLQETSNCKILKLWKNCLQKNYGRFRMEFLRSISEPAFQAVLETVEQTYEVFFPSTVWAEIWEFRAP